MCEFWDLYDENRHPVNRTHLRGLPLPEGLRHLVAQAVIRNPRHEILLTRRAPEKHYPNLWECTGGGVLCGEHSLEAALREVREETGIRLEPREGIPLCTERRKDSWKDTWLFQRDVPLEEIRLQPGETVDAKWVSCEEFAEMCRRNEIVPILIDALNLAYRFDGTTPGLK